MADFELKQYLATVAQLPSSSTKALVAASGSKLCAAGDVLARQDEPNAEELILLSGKAVCSIIDKNGTETVVGFYHGATVLPPHISRSRENRSLITIKVLSSATLAAFSSDEFMDLMVQDEPIRNWANDIMRGELQRRAEHQWALAALNNKDKLSWFRSNYDGFEEKFDHWRIASYLGMTPVSLSRVRAQLV